MDDRTEGAVPAEESDRDAAPPSQPSASVPGRAGRGPDEGPAPGGGSSLEAHDEAAEEEIGGGD